MFVPKLEKIEQGYSFEEILPKKIELKEGEKHFFVAGKVSDLEINVAAGAEVTLLFLSAESADSSDLPNFIKVNLNGAEAKVKVLLGAIMRENLKREIQLKVNHLHAVTESLTIVKNLMYDQASLSFKGNIFIPRESQQSKAFFQHDGLLMSKESRSATIPSLEIIANDVQAGHSASVGKLDEEILFYCQARGLSRVAAEELLVRGFLEGIFKEIGNESLVEQLREYYEGLL
jgi:Fe-S cluster assembly scaffold protein SufB